MNVIRCKNGHFFDGDSYSTCPHCGAVAMIAGSAEPVKEPKRGFWGRSRKDKGADASTNSKTPSVTPGNDFASGNTPTDVIESNKPESSSTPPLKENPTLDFWQTSSHSDNRVEENVEEKEYQDSKVIQLEMQSHTPASEQPEVKKDGFTREVSRTNEHGSSLREAVKKSSASNEGKTMSYFNTATGAASGQPLPRPSADPVVGWLVCIDGCHFGECFCIYAGKNSIGRSEENRIVVADDNSISRMKHALIVYEPKKRNFYLQPGDSRGLTYLNEEYITESHRLAAQDIIELGDSKFLFVPLCGETFSWEEHMPKGE